MQMAKCPIYTTCKYVKDQPKIVHFRAKHRFSGFVNKPLAVNRNVSCAMRQTCTKFSLFNVFFTRVLIPCFKCAILFINSLWNLYPVNYLICSLFSNFFNRMLEMVRECTQIKRDLVCSMITISENATPKSTLVVDPWCNCKKQEYQDFIPKQW